MNDTKPCPHCGWQVMHWRDMCVRCWFRRDTLPSPDQKEER